MAVTIQEFVTVEVVGPSSAHQANLYAQWVNKWKWQDDLAYVDQRDRWTAWVHTPRCAAFVQEAEARGFTVGPDRRP